MLQEFHAYKNIKFAIGKSRKRFRSLINLFEKNRISEPNILKLEELLIESDIGYNLTQEILEVVKGTKEDQFIDNLEKILIM